MFGARRVDNFFSHMEKSFRVERRRAGVTPTLPGGRERTSQERARRRDVEDVVVVAAPQGLGIAVESPRGVPPVARGGWPRGDVRRGVPVPASSRGYVRGSVRPRARGSRGATVASVALAGCVALAGVVTLASRAGVLPHLIPPRAGARALPPPSTPHLPSPDLDIPEVFVITDRDADGPTGEWRRVDAATKAQMEAEALKAEHPERKSRTSSPRSPSSRRPSPARRTRRRQPRRRASLSGYFDDEAAARLDTSSAEEAQKIADDTRANERREAAARDGVSTARAWSTRDGGAETRTRGAQIATIAVAEIEAQERAWELEQRREARAARGVESGGDVLSGVAAAGDSERALTFSDGASIGPPIRPRFPPNRPPIGPPSISRRTWTASRRFATRTRVMISTSPRDSTRDRRRAIRARRRRRIRPRARAVPRRDVRVGIFSASTASRRMYTRRVRAVKDGVCNMGRARLNVVFYADSAETCGFAKALYAAGRDAANRDEPADAAPGRGPIPMPPPSATRAPPATPAGAAGRRDGGDVRERARVGCVVQQGEFRDGDGGRGAPRGGARGGRRYARGSTRNSRARG